MSQVSALEQDLFAQRASAAGKTMDDRRARNAVYKRFEGQAGSGEVALQMLPKKWTSDPVIAVTKNMDVVHRTIGRASFEVEKLEQNLKALVDALVKGKPASSKGQYLKKIAVSSTMGPGVRVDSASL